MIKQRWGVNVLRIKETPKMRAKVKKKITIIIIIIISPKYYIHNQMKFKRNSKIPQSLNRAITGQR